MEVSTEKVGLIFKKNHKLFVLQGSQGTDSGYHSGPANVPNRGGLDIDRFYGVSRDHVSTHETFVLAPHIAQQRRKNLFFAIFYGGILGTPSHLDRNWFAIQNQGHWGLPSASGKIRTFLEPFGKLEIIWKIRIVLKVLGQFKRFFPLICAKTFPTRKNFPVSNATLLPRFLHLCCLGIIIQRSELC